MYFTAKSIYRKFRCIFPDALWIESNRFKTFNRGNQRRNILTFKKYPAHILVYRFQSAPLAVRDDGCSARLRFDGGNPEVLFGSEDKCARTLHVITQHLKRLVSHQHHIRAGLALGADGLPGESDLPRLLDDFHAREILHVTYGSVLTEKTAQGRLRFYDRLIALLRLHPEAYAQNLERHFIKHLQPFVR